MEFGKVVDPSNVKFTMPPDNAQTEAVLSRLLPSGDVPLRMYVGGTNWGTKEWVGTLYPKAAKEKDFLSLYARQLNTIELNTLFYNLQPVSVIEKWANMTESGFKFCPKFTQSISHELQLENAERETDQFIERVQSFGAKLGPSFLQLSDRFGPDRSFLLQRYLRRIPSDLPMAVELRHEDWFRGAGLRDPLWQVMEELGIGTVITDTSGRRDCLHMRLTAPRAFVRFVANNLHPTDLTRLDAWAERLKGWIGSGLREIYFFVHSHNERHSPELCRHAIERFNAVCGTGLRVPVLSNGGRAENLSLF